MYQHSIESERKTDTDLVWRRINPFLLSLTGFSMDNFNLKHCRLISKRFVYIHRNRLYTFEICFYHLVNDHYSRMLYAFFIYCFSFRLLNLHTLTIFNTTLRVCAYSRCLVKVVVFYNNNKKLYNILLNK